MSFIPWWVHYPNVNNEILNLDWLLKVSNCNTHKIENFINLNTIKYADPILWNITSQYEANTVVVDGQTGNAYISTKAVPSGVHLNRTEYWTQIYNYADALGDLRSQIAFDEGNTTTASKAFAVGDLVFVNELLYRVIAPMIAGDSFVVDSNIVKTTIENELDILQTNIDNEATVRSDADILLQDHIDDEVTARSDADILLQDHIDAISHIIYTSNYASISDILSALGDDDILCLNSEVDVDNETVVINNKIISTPDGKFSGTPTSFTINNQVILPSWFGIKKADSNYNNAPAIQKAINACPVGGKVYLERGEYYVSTPITIDKVISFVGDREGTYITAGTSTASPVLTLAGDGATYVDGATISDMIIGRYQALTGSTGLYITSAANTLIRNVKSVNHEECFKFKFTTSTRVEGCLAFNAYTQDFFGYLLDCTQNPPLAGTSANGSFYLVESSVNSVLNNANTTGFYITGIDCRDIFIDKFECGNCTTGLNFDCTAGCLATDIYLSNIVIDGCRGIGLRIKNIPNLDGGVKVTNIFVNLNSNATPSNAIAVLDSYNVLIQGAELYGHLTDCTAISISGSQDCKFENILVNDCGYGIVAATVVQNIFSNITIKRNSSYAGAIIIDGNLCVLTGFTIKGAYTTGIALYGLSHVVLGGSVNGVTTATDDQSTSSQIAYIV